MKIRIKETNELQDLTIIGANGIEWTNDLLGNNNATDYNAETEEHEMSLEDYNWWKEYIDENEKDAEDITALAEELEIDESEIWDRINENITCDLGDEHQIKQNVMNEIKAERA